MNGPAAQPREIISFGPFSLVPGERLLTRDGVPVEVGARTFDMLMALVSRPNEVIAKRELMAKVWPDVIVEEGSLRFHIQSLRAVLGEGKDGARYITTFAGRGYCFVAPIVRLPDRANGQAKLPTPVSGANFLPGRLMRMVGRDDGVITLSKALRASRFVTIVGSGGIGKTTVAVAVAHELLEAFAGAALFLDLAMLSEPAMVATTLASFLGLSVQSDDPTPGVAAYLRDKRLLLLLDNCEHLIEAAAVLAERIFSTAPHVHILATSREALRVEGEQVHKIEPLAFPPEDLELTAEVALTFPAIQLFMERAAASGARLGLSNADTAIVASICRKLDGVALAIELAAGRVQAYGLQQTAALLDQRLSLLWQGQRTAPARQQTLHAMLDWSYGLLSEPERIVFRRLAMFPGSFTMEAALAVVTSQSIDQDLVLVAIDNLVAKSMVTMRSTGAMVRYRLLATTHAYAREIKIDDAEFTEMAMRHASYFRRWLEQAGAEWPTLSNATERAPHLAGAANARVALEWCFGVGANAEIGIGLAAAAAPVFLAMSLLEECHRWSERAILALDDATRGETAEMHLQAALGLSLMFTQGQSEVARAALDRSLLIAEACGDALNQLQLLGGLHIFHERIGDFELALHYAKRGSAVSETVQDTTAIVVARSNLGIALHLAGDHSGARVELEAALRQTPATHRASTIYLGFDYHNRAAIALARTLWLQGDPTGGVELARRTVAQAAEMDHPVTLCIALIWAVSVFFWTGDLESAESNIDRFIAHADSHSLAPYLPVWRGVKAQLAVRQGDTRGGVESLLACLAELQTSRYGLLTTEFEISLVQGLAVLGRFDEAMARIDGTLGRVEANGDLLYMPELLRVKGGLLLSMPQPDVTGAAETCFLQSLDWSRRQAAPAWELRAAVDLCTLLITEDRAEHARGLLQPVFERFSAGADSADLQAAERLLSSIC